uniref:RNA-directed DNA polymerase n=1 Tax=Strongyloides venezuelensis TaxID=75913 RepID=A0A0K0FFK5_STRVS
MKLRNNKVIGLMNLQRSRSEMSLPTYTRSGKGGGNKLEDKHNPLIDNNSTPVINNNIFREGNEIIVNVNEEELVNLRDGRIIPILNDVRDVVQGPTRMVIVRGGLADSNVNDLQNVRDGPTDQEVNDNENLGGGPREFTGMRMIRNVSGLESINTTKRMREQNMINVRESVGLNLREARRVTDVESINNNRDPGIGILSTRKSPSFDSRNNNFYSGEYSEFERGNSDRNSRGYSNDNDMNDDRVKSANNQNKNNSSHLNPFERYNRQIDNERPGRYRRHEETSSDRSQYTFHNRSKFGRNYPGNGGNGMDVNQIRQLMNGLSVAIDLEKFTGEDEAFSVWLTRFDAFCYVRNIPRKLRAPVLIMHLSKNPARDVANRKELQNNYDLLVSYLSTNFQGAMNRNAARARLDMLEIRKIEDIRKVGSEINTLVDLIEKDASMEERFRKKLHKMADLVPAQIRGTLKYGGCCDSFELAMVVAEDLWKINIEAKKDRLFNSNRGNRRSKSKSKGFTENCFKCGERGHRAKECKKKPNLQVSSLNISSLKKLPKIPVIPIKLDETLAMAMLDTGASISVISKELGDKLNIPIERKKISVKTMGPDRCFVFKTCHEQNLTIGENDKFKMKMYVASDNFNSKDYDVILGTDILSKVILTVDMKKEKIIINNQSMKLRRKEVENTPMINVICEQISLEEEEELKKELKNSYPEVICKHELDCGEGKIESGPILVTSQELPKYPRYRTPECDKPIIENYIQRLIENKIIRKMDTNFLHPVLALKKSNDPTKRRICGDMRAINEITIPTKYPTPLIEDLVDETVGHDFYSVIDMNNAYFQISLPAQSQQYMGIFTDSGSYCFLRLVQGAKNSACEFQKIADTICHKVGNCKAFIDDFIVFTRGDIATHLIAVKNLLKEFSNLGLKINLEKSRIGGKKIKFVGHEINKNGSCPSLENRLNFLQRKLPSSKRQVKSFIQSGNFFRRYVPNFSTIVAPLLSLTRKRKRFEMTPEAEDAYYKLRELIGNPKILHKADRNKPFYLTCDASSTGLGAMLSQYDDEGNELPISFWSYRLSESKRGRAPTILEMMSISKAVSHYRHVLLGSELIIRSDHLPIKGLLKKNNDAKFAELMIPLHEMNYRFEYIKGKDNIIPDDLSRLDQEEILKNSSKLNKSKIDEEEKELESLQKMRVEKSWEREKKLENEKCKMVNCLNILTGEIDKVNDSSDEEDVKPSTKEQSLNKIDDEIPLLQKLYFGSEDNFDKITTEEQLNDPFIKEAFEEKMYDKRKIIELNNQIMIEDLTGMGYVVIVPNSKIGTVLNIAHNLSGHYNAEKIFRWLKDICFWKNMFMDIQLHVKRCKECLLGNDIHAKKYNQKSVIFSRPMQSVSIDVCGPMNVISHEGNRYILGIIDNFSRFLIMTGLKDLTYTSIVNSLFKELFFRHGIPEEIHNDNAKSLVNNRLTSLYQMLNIKQTTGTPYYKKANVLIERAFRQLHNICTKLITKEIAQDWDELLLPMTYFHNTMLHDTLKCTPYEIFYGQSCRTPLHVMLGKQPNSLFDKDVDRWELTKNAMKAYKHIEDTTAECREKENKKKGGTEFLSFEKGEMVCIKRPPNKEEKIIPHKFQSPFIEGYKVVKDLGSKLKVHKGTRGRCLIVHKSDCKKVYQNKI